MDTALVGGAAFLIIIVILVLGARAMRRGSKHVVALATLVTAIGGLIASFAIFIP